MKTRVRGKGWEKLEKHGKAGMADAPPPWRATSRLMAGVLGGLKAASAAGGWLVNNTRMRADGLVPTLTYCQPKLVLTIGSTFTRIAAQLPVPHSHEWSN